MTFQAQCEEADRRYKAGKAPLYVEGERWDRAREVLRKLGSGSIPVAWREWSLDRLYWFFQRVAGQARPWAPRRVPESKRRRELVPARGGRE